LQLGFDNISDATTEQLLAHYNGSSGGFDRFTLPASLFAGMTTTLRGYIQAPTSIRWEYAGPPEVQSVYTGRSRVSITLIGELDF
jgi:outer membrane lipoprotein-sorting protein